MDQDAAAPRQQGGNHMSPALAAARPARHQGRPQVRRRQQPPAKHPQDGARPREQPRAPRLRQTAPAASPNCPALAIRHDTQAQSAQRPRQDRDAAAVQGIAGFRPVGLAPDQDRPGRIDDERRPGPPGRPQHRGPSVGPGEHLCSRAQADKGSRRQAYEPPLHGASSPASDGVPVIASSTSSAAASMRRWW
ncbi:hypothetical protein D3C71_898750 [compost metagenome]